MQLVINADDFAFNKNISEAICECFRRSLITQTTVMVNMPFFEHSIKMAKSNRFYEAVGLHLNLTYGVPLTENIKQCPIFCNPDGSFSARFHTSLIGRIWLSKFEREAVRKEIVAQMTRYLDAGFRLMHIDSHHHSHTDLSIVSIIVSMAEKLGFRSIRLSRNFCINGIVKRSYKILVNRCLARSHLKTCDYFVGGVSSIENSIRTISAGEGVFELMVHPRYGYTDVSGNTVSPCDLYDFKTPIKSLENAVHIMRMCGAKFISYSDIQ